MNCIKDKFQQDLPENRWYPTINVCDCPKEDDSTEFNGLPKVTLEKNIQLRVNYCGRPEKYNLLTQDSFLTENTIYIVQYDFDLNGGIIRIPKNSTLVFYGGSIANGTVLLDDTSIYPMLDLDKYLFCRVSGTYKKGQIKSDENGIYYWNGEGWVVITEKSDQDIPTPTPTPGPEYTSGVGITIKEDNSINLNSAGEYSLGGIRTGFISQDNRYAVQTDENSNAYVVVQQHDKDVTFFKSFVFKRSEIKPDAPVGGSFVNPVPYNWSDGIPEGTEKVWVSSRVFYSDGNTDRDWTPPVLLADSPDMDVCFSNRETPNPPTTHGIQQTGEWHNDARVDDIWMAISLYSMGEWGPWQIVKIKGEQGPPGNDGKDGTSINIVGEYLDSDNQLSYIDNSNVFQGFNISNVRPVGTLIRIGITLKIVGGDFDGHLMYCMDDTPLTWIDLGVIEGAATYVHIKFSNDGGETFTEASEDNPTAQPGDTPGDYIGFLTDNKQEATLDVNLYKPWVPFKGNDGFGYYFIYTKSTPEYMVENAQYYETRFLYNGEINNFTDGTGLEWYDEPAELNPGEYQYVSYIKEPLYINKKWSTPKLWNNYPVTYNLVISNKDNAILDLNNAAGLKQNKEISWVLYENGKEVSDYSKFYFEIYCNNQICGSSTSNTWNLSGIPYGTQKSVISITVESLENKNQGKHIILCNSELSFPIQGLNGESIESSGFKVVLSNDIGVVPCYSDGSSLSGTSTNISAYFNDQLLNSGQYSVNFAEGDVEIDFRYNTKTTTVQGQYKATLSQSLDNTYYILNVKNLYSNNSVSSIPFIITYNDISYSKSFELFKDYDGDSYELVVTPKVLIDRNNVDVKVFKTYDRASKKNIYEEVNSNTNNSLKVKYYNNNNILTESGFPRNLVVYPNSQLYLIETINGIEQVIDRAYITNVSVGEASQGLAGCVLRFRGDWKSGQQYVNELNDTSKGATAIRWIDYVKYNSNYYLVAPKVNEARITSLAPTSDNVGEGKDWIQAESMDFAYIQTLISDYISTTSLQAHQLLITRGSERGSDIVAGMHEGNQQQYDRTENVVIWSGTQIQKNSSSDNLNVSSAPFQVIEDGTLIATQAKIKGDIQANQFVTGSETECGISVIAGDFSAVGANQKKAYFAFDGISVNMYVYYSGAWHKLDFSKCASTLDPETFYTFEGSQQNPYLSIIDHQFVEENGVYKNNQGNLVNNDTSHPYYSYSKTENLIILEYQEVLSDYKFAIIPVEFYNAVIFTKGVPERTNTYKLISKGKVVYTSGNWSVQDNNLYYQVYINSTNIKVNSISSFTLFNTLHESSSVNPTSIEKNTIYYIKYGGNDSILPTYSYYTSSNTIKTEYNKTIILGQ